MQGANVSAHDSLGYFAMQMFFGSVKKRSASFPPSRPTPLCFIPPNGHAQVAHQPAIHPDRAGVNLLRDAMRAVEVLRPDGGGEAVIGVVRVGQTLPLRGRKA